MISRQQFIDMTGEDPVDVLGADWENDVEEYLEEEKCDHCGHLPGTGACYYCKMD